MKLLYSISSVHFFNYHVHSSYEVFKHIQIKVQTWLQCETFIKYVLTHSESMLVEEQLLLARER